MPWSLVDTECSIHRVRHILSTAFTHDWLSSLHSHDYKLTPECSFSFRRASPHNRPPLASSPWVLKGKVSLSHSHLCESTNWWIESQHPARRVSTTSKYSSNFARSRPPKCITKLACLQHPSSHDHGLLVHLPTHSIMACKCVSKLARSWSRSAYLSSLDHGLQVYLQIRSITASKCISKLTRLPPSNASPYSLDPDHGAHL